MTLLLRKARPVVLAVALGSLCTNVAAAEVPSPGCYERIYDAAHLASHPGQLVVRATLLVKPLDAADAAALGASYTANAQLRIWVKSHRHSFDSVGACRTANGGLNCEGSLSAAEADPCKIGNDGIHRNCRIGAATSGAFGVTFRSDGLIVKVLRRLELVNEPYDGGPFLYLSPGNAENRSFALKPAPEATCTTYGG